MSGARILPGRSFSWWHGCDNTSTRPFHSPDQMCDVHTSQGNRQVEDNHRRLSAQNRRLHVNSQP